MSLNRIKFGLQPEVIEKINTVFEKYSFIDQVIIYGSRAKGSFKPGSDIDLTLQCGQSVDLSFLFKIENDLDNLLLPYKIDLSFYNLLDNKNLLDHIERIGVEFYRRTKS